jgi:hypothetical protein
MLRRHFTGLLLAGSVSRLRAQSGRPRLFLTPGRIAALKAAITATHAELWRSAQRKADSIIAKSVPKYPAQVGPNDELLWQREVANKIPLLALVALLTEDQKYLTATIEWAMESCGYPHWGTGTEDGVGLAAGHQLFSLALVYDWLGDRLSSDARETLRRTLLQRGATMYAAGKGELPIERSYWRLTYLTNRLWVNAAGLAGAGWALGDEPGVNQWIELALDKFRRTETFRGADGASHEGIGYWSYGLEYQLKFWHLAADLAGETPSSAWWKNTAAYRQYLALPRNSWKEDNTAVDIADSQRADEYGADHLLYRLAALNRDPHAQWLAGELRRAGVTSSVPQWLDLLWFDPSVTAKGPAGLPTLRHFDDMGIVSARSGWSGDESLVVFKCGPPIGHFATDKLSYNLGIGHNHPDANHFSIYGCGEWLLRDDGYAWKDTGQHNTLLVDGKGQVGEGFAWFDATELNTVKVHPRVLAAVFSESLDEISGDATAVYPPASGLKRFVRRLYFLKPDVLIVADDIEVDAPRRLELRFHPESPCDRGSDGSFLARGPKATLRIELFTKDGVEETAGEVDGRDKAGKAMPMHTVRMGVTRAAWKNVVAFSWSPNGTEPIRLTQERAGEEWVLRAGERSVRLTP